MQHLFSFFTKHKGRAITLAVLWTLLIFVACLIPGNEVPNIDVPFADKWVHFIIFGGFAFLWLCTIKKAALKHALALFIISALLGYFVELLQGSGITRGRSYDPYDIAADALGGLMGVLAFMLLQPPPTS